MIRALFSVVLWLFASTTTLGQSSPSPQTTDSVRPCALHLVNGRICVTEEVLRDRVAHVAPKLPEGANENGEVVLHVIIPATGERATKVSVVSGDPPLTGAAIQEDPLQRLFPQSLRPPA